MPPTASGSDSFVSSYSVAIVALEDLRPYPQNARTHSATQIAQLADLIEEFGWTVPILAEIDGDGTIIAGHGRRQAALKIYAAGGTIRLPDGRRLPAGTVPAIDCTGWSEEQRRTYILADNQVALNASWDDAVLKLELTWLQASPDIEVTLTGFTGNDLDKALGLTRTQGAQGGVDAYSRKIRSPVYEPKGDAPDVTELYDDSKAQVLAEEILAAGLPADITAFLEAAAQRHTVFNFRRIADFYASADAETQALMEASALVIVDFNQAIDKGFVRLTKRLGNLASGSPEAGEDELNEE